MDMQEENLLYFYAGEPLCAFEGGDFDVSVYFYEISESKLCLLYPGGHRIFDKRDCFIAETAKELQEIAFDILTVMPDDHQQFISFCFISRKDEVYAYDEWKGLFTDAFLICFESANPASHVYFYRFDYFEDRLKRPGFEAMIPDIVIRGILNRSAKLKLPLMNNGDITKLLEDPDIAGDAKQRRRLFGSGNSDSLLSNLFESIERTAGSDEDMFYFSEYLSQRYREAFERDLQDGSFEPESPTREPYSEWLVRFRGAVKMFAKPYQVSRVEKGESPDRHRCLLLVMAYKLKLSYRETKTLFLLGKLVYEPLDKAEALLMFMIDKEIYPESKKYYKVLDYLGYADLDDAVKKLSPEFKKKKKKKRSKEII